MRHGAAATCGRKEKKKAPQKTDQRPHTHTDARTHFTKAQAGRRGQSGAQTVDAQTGSFQAQIRAPSDLLPITIFQGCS